MSPLSRNCRIKGDPQSAHFPESSYVGTGYSGSFSCRPSWNVLWHSGPQSCARSSMYASRCGTS
ncbi:hypothetical protein CALCODRAFT_326010 [Calocera cornea HHB12733]|uniref:Uncharacterized protein n=1 Tax=Calocera cornea HHB12733 TaxID=1353952 RepID=A0A165JFZ6_9BASI|nr:hypothetical protein CALCODRAFT_326010 [Calocera cornea HHB12733]